MKNKLLAWFKVNKILIPFILISLAVWIVVPLSLMPRPEQVEEDIPIVEIGRFDLETGDAILLYQKGDNLVAHFEQTVHHSDGDVRETKSTVFAKVFNQIIVSTKRQQKEFNPCIRNTFLSWHTSRRIIQALRISCQPLVSLNMKQLSR